MGRRRERISGMGLLPRMEAFVGKTVTSYRYHPVKGKPIPLGRDRQEAIRRVLDLQGKAPDTGTLRWVWDKYKVSPRFVRLAPATRTDYEQCWEEIGPILGKCLIGSLRSTDIARYVRVERASAPSRANHEKALLSNLFFHGIDLGLCTDNPARLVRPNVEEPRTEAPHPDVLATFVEWAMRQSPQRRIVALAARYASLGGSRKAEFLDLAWPQIDRAAGQVRTKRAKQRGKKRGEVVDVVAISPALGQVLDELAATRDPECLYVFPMRDGNAYSESGFKTLWQRIMTAAVAEGILSPAQRFTFHDLRAFYATEHKRQRGALPDLHKNPATTAGIYDRSREVKRAAL
jgi:integrase